MPIPRPMPVLLVLAALAAAGSGCALVKMSQTLLAGKPVDPAGSGPRSTLPKIPESKYAVQLEVYFVERPAGDPLIEHSLWKEVVQAGVVEPDVRTRLEQSGLCVGIATSNPPRAVQALLGLSSDIPDGTGRLTSHPVLVPSGVSTVIPCTLEPLAACTMTVKTPTGDKVRDYEEASCVLRVTATRTEPGWVHLEFQPEVHHGEHAFRPVTAASPHGLDWNFQEGQRVEPLWHQRFSLKLNLGEWVILGSTGDDLGSVGSHFFTAGDADARTRRVLAIRVRDTLTANPVRAERSL